MYGSLEDDDRELTSDTVSSSCQLFAKTESVEAYNRRVKDVLLRIANNPEYCKQKPLTILVFFACFEVVLGVSTLLEGDLVRILRIIARHL